MSGATVDQGFAAWLKAEQLLVSLDSPVAARWQAIGATAEGSSPFATSAGALAEAQRRLAWAGPVAIDKAVVPGERRDLVGQCVTLRAPTLGYDAGEAVLVIRVAEQDNDTSLLTIIRRLT